MSGIDLAQGYVQLMPSMDGFINKVRTELDAPLTGLGKTTGTSMGNNILQSIGKAMSSAGSYLTKHITVPAMAAATAVGGIFAAKGFQRLTAIDDARAKLVALRFDAETVEGVMGSALESVKGTSFGLGEAATTAASAVAAGIKPGQDLTRYLSLAADAASVAGISMEEMGSIMNKVQSQNKAYNSELQMLADKGLPIYQWLADAAGVSGEEIFDMASKGQVSAEMLYSAIENNIGGAAKIMGELSLSASMQNAWAAIGRVGAAFLGAGDDANSFFGQLKPLIGEFTGWLDFVTPYAAELGKVFSESFAIVVNKVKELTDELGITMPTLDEFKEMVADIPTKVASAMDWLIGKVREIKEWFFGLSAPVQDFITKLLGVAPIALVALGPLLSICGKVATALNGIAGVARTVISVMCGGISNISKFVGGLRGVESAAKSAAGKLGLKTAALWANFSAMAANAASGLASVFSRIGQQAAQGAAKVLAFAAANKAAAFAALGILGVIAGIGAYMISTGSSFADLGDKIAGFATKAVEVVKGIVSQIPGIVAAMGPAISTFVTELLPQFLQALPSIITAGAQVLVGLIESFTAMLPQFIEAGVQILVSLIEGFTAALPQLIEGAISAITSVVGVIVMALPLLITAAITLFMGIVQALSQILPPLIEGIVALIEGVVGMLHVLIPSLIAAALALFMAIVQALPMILTALIEAALMVINALIVMLPSLIPILISAAITLFMALVQALPQIIGALINGVISVIMALVGMLPTLIPLLLEAAITLFMALVEALPVIIPALIDGGIQLIMAVVGMLPTLIPALLEAAITLFMAIVQAIPEILSALLGAIGTLIQDGINHLPTFLSNLGTEAKNLFMGIANAVPKILSDLKNKIGELIQGGVNKVGDFVNDMLRAGENLIKGVVDGIGNGINWVKNKITEVCESALDTLKSFFGIASPSKVMAQMGSYLMEGFADGITEDSSLVVSALEEIAKDATDILDGISTEVDLPLALSVSAPSWSTNRRAELDPRNVGDSYSIGDITYTPDSRIAHLIQELFHEINRTQRMGVMA